ncbi:LURP-one-related/scramblase family protein [Clostridium sp. DL1XJH146]
MKKKNFLIMIVFGVVAIYFFKLAFFEESEGLNTFYIVIATCALIACVVVWQYRSQETYNSWNDTIKMIFNTNKTSIDNIYEAFKSMDTVLGKPWIGKIKTVKENCIIFGPNAEGEYIYVLASKEDRIQLVHNSEPGFIVPMEGEEWRLNFKEIEKDNTDKILRYRFATIFMIKELTDKIDRFLETGIPDLNPIGIEMDTDIYLLYEKFKWFGQDFYLNDVQENKKMEISSRIPCKTFHIKQVADGMEMFKITKKIFHFMPHYAMYEHGNKIGVIKKKLVFKHNYFVSDSIYGKLELRSMNATIGRNYQVTIENKQIGIISEKLNIQLQNIIFDNFVLVVNDPKYFSLMIAMAVMVEREKKRSERREMMNAD